ncbi:adenylyl-sulfate kinase [Thalassobaculum sp. OXR-137]|uniref:adenylyl-sulfate kinase n=1 Tax=Thalassobaculum sp. OXR-137 TaxID=3100173 RepID=UPI002AC920A0|nr:adenylyl-sulfate kinase [Thalassobaculum sp. OXR-137]WPZ36189.1 adenylyl-sulfate kinase [Thalassobaculum sp. OXR-137]
MVDGVLWWITGLSGSGKTTIARALVKKLDIEKIPVVHFDGDELRSIFNAESSFDNLARLELAHRYSRLCEVVTKRGVDVVCSTMSLFHEIHVANRSRFPRYREIFLDVPMSVLEQRDQRGLYSGARAGRATNVVGVNSAVEIPTAPNLVLVNDGGSAPDFMAEQIYALRPLTD